MSYKKQKLLTLDERMRCFCGVHIAHLFRFLRCVFRFACLLSVSCVQFCVSGFSIVDRLSDFN